MLQGYRNAQSEWWDNYDLNLNKMIQNDRPNDANLRWDKLQHGIEVSCRAPEFSTMRYRFYCSN